MPAPEEASVSQRVRPRLPAWLLAALLVLATLAVYWPATRCDFTNYDDPDYVTANPQVQIGLTRESVTWAFGHRVSGNWHPVTMLSHMLDCQLFGLKPWGPHFINVLLHSLNAALVFVLLRQLTNATWRSLLVAGLFAVHPLHVESVAWVSERKDVLSGFFGLLALIFYVRYAQKRSRGEGRESTEANAGGASGLSRPAVIPAKRLVSSLAPPNHAIDRLVSSLAPPSHALDRLVGSLAPPNHAIDYVLALLCFVLGLMSKPMLVTWPFVMLLLDYWPLGRLRISDFGFRISQTLRSILLEKLPFFALAVAASAMALVVQRQEGAMLSAESLPLGARVANALISYSRYLGKLFCPTKLAVFYPLPSHWPVVMVLLAGGLILGLSLLFWAQRRQRPFWLIGWLWYLGTLVPVIGLVQVGEQAMADRYMYLPSIGLLILIVWGGYELTKSWPQRGIILSGFSAGAVILCIAVTRQQLGYWRDSEALFRHALAATESNATAHNQLGTAFFNQGKMDEAINQYQEAIRLQPTYPDPYFNLGNALVKNGQLAEAISQFQEYIRLNPNDAVAHFNLATAFYNEGQLKEAIRQYQETIRLEPDNVDARTNLGIALGRTGQLDEAIQQFREVIRLKPDFAEVHNNLGIALLNKSQTDEAISQFREAIRLNPRNPSAYNNLGIAFDRQGKIDEAISQYQQAIHLVPGYAETYSHLGADFAAKGEFDEAITNYHQAIQIDPGRPDFYFRLGMTLGQAGRTQEAVAQYRRALSLNPNLTLALNNLAWALATSPEEPLRNGPEAVRLAERACELTQYHEPLFLGTLAAAYAEAGRFPDAVTTAEKAENLATDAGLTSVAAANRQLLQLYRAGKPYRSPSRPRQ